MSHKLSRPSWKQCALLLILLSHAVFGSPIVPAPASAYETLSPVSQADTLSTSNLQASLEEDVFGPTHDERSERKKRLLYETLKKAKQAKLLSLGAASSNAAKSIGKSVFKTVATLGIKAIIFNFLYSKINQVLDFKTRVLNNLEHKNREQNSQVLGIGDSSTAGSSINTTTELPANADEESTFNPNKISLNLSPELLATGFNVISSTATIIQTLIQNTALRIARLSEALKPLLRSSSSLKSKKRETDFDVTGFDDPKGSNSDVVKRSEKLDKTPVKNSFAALTQ